jgi:hypothetical protein
LHESARELFLLPWRGRLARAEANRDVLHANGLPRLQRQVANDPVALVQQAEHRNALGHRGHSGNVPGPARHVERDGLISLDFILTIAGRSRDEQRQRQICSASPHAWSGFHAS